jgi:hypothetical protein
MAGEDTSRGFGNTIATTVKEDDDFLTERGDDEISK